jgi:hypothetical protein
VLEGEELDMIIRGEELPPLSRRALNALKSMKVNGEPTQVDNKLNRNNNTI